MDREGALDSKGMVSAKSFSVRQTIETGKGIERTGSHVLFGEGPALAGLDWLKPCCRCITSW